MKRLMMILALLTLSALLCAGEMEDALRDIFDYSSVEEIDGRNTLIPNDYLDGEESGYNFVSYAVCCWVFVRNGWDETEYSSTLESMEDVQAIGATWMEEGYDVMLTIPLWMVYEQFGADDCDDMDGDEVYEAIQRFVEANASLAVSDW